MFSSTIIPTISRSTLSRAVQSVLDQSFSDDDFEVIVVNDSGKSLPEEEWQHSPQVRVINTNRHERSVARNTGAAIAQGKYLHFLDDDDVLTPGALNAFWKLAQSSNAIWLYGGYQTVDNEGNLVNEFSPDLRGNIFAYLIVGESIPLQASILDAKSFFAAGSFDPTISATEDRDLFRRLAILGEVLGTETIVSQIRVGEVGSSTDWTKLAENDRLGREKAFREFGAFRRLRESAKTNELRGRVCRAYIASVVWNLKRGNFLISVSRAAAGLYFAFPAFITPSYWRGLITKIK